MFQKTLLLGLWCIVLVCEVIQGQQCTTNNKGTCGPEDPDEQSCTKYLGCCWIKNAKGLSNKDRCRHKSRGASRSTGGQDIENSFKEYYEQLQGDLPKKPKEAEAEKQLEVVLEKFNPGNELSKDTVKQQIKSNKKGKAKAAARSIGLGNPFGNLGGLGSLGGSLLPLIAGFPTCPVHIKICHRTPCGGANSGYLQNNPAACTADPTCCYDYFLGFYRRIFGPRFMGDAPVCYNGATSRQWRYVTQLIRPWNPFFVKPFLTIFEKFFDNSLLNIQGQLACKFDIFKTKCPAGVTEKIDCNLKDCCYDEDTGECYKASKFIQDAIGTQQVYPSLYTNDPRDAKCLLTPFDFGPRAYSRQPCSLGDQPSDAFELMYNWCPQSECCLNFYNLKSTDLTSILLFSSLSGGGGGFGGGLFGQSPAPQISLPPALTQLGGGGLLGGGGGLSPLLFTSFLSEGSDTLKNLLCPYYFAKLTSNLPSLDAEGCCEVPTCYYKKTLVGGGGGGGVVYPPPPSNARYAAWSGCQGSCGSYGTRTRQCYYNNQVSPGSCSHLGPSQERCQTGPCIQPPPPPAQWSSWRMGQCSVTCGAGYATYSRSCMRYGQPVNAAECGGGPTTESRPCNAGPCPIRYQWGDQMEVFGTCERVCTGRQVMRQVCYGADGTRVDNSFCGGSGRQDYRDCSPEPCHGGGGGGGGPSYGTPTRLCRTEGTTTQYQICQQVQECAPVSQYYWSQFGSWSTCRWEGQRCQRSRQRSCYEQRGNSYDLVNPQSLCGQERFQYEDCAYSQC